MDTLWGFGPIEKLSLKSEGTEKSSKPIPANSHALGVSLTPAG